jgi:hypothetical protein
MGNKIQIMFQQSERLQQTTTKQSGKSVGPQICERALTHPAYLTQFSRTTVKQRHFYLERINKTYISIVDFVALRPCSRAEIAGMMHIRHAFYY